MTGIDRRTLIAAAGATATLAASKSAGGAEKKPAAQDRITMSQILSAQGIDDGYDTKPPENYSGNFDRIPWYEQGKPEPKFVPKRIQLIYLKFSGTGLVIDGIFRDVQTTANPDDQDGEADKVAREEITYYAANGKWSPMADANAIVNRVPWRYKQATKIYIILSGGMMKFDNDNKIRFTRYSASKGNRSNCPNNSFFNCEITSVFGPETMIIRNWYLDENGNPIRGQDEHDGASRRYSMNIHLLMPVGSGIDLPVILDPDVGNNGGEP